VNGDGDLAELTVVTACHKKDVKAFLQFFPSVSDQDRTNNGRLAVTRALPPSWIRASFPFWNQSCLRARNLPELGCRKRCARNPYWMQHLVRLCTS